MQFQTVKFLAVCAIVTAASGIVEANAADDWAMYQGNLEHNGFVAETLLPASTTILWSANPQAPAGAATIAIVGNLIITTPGPVNFQNPASVVAQDADSGLVRWTIDFPGVFSINQPAIDGDVIYFTARNGTNASYLFAYNSDGTFAWRTPISGQYDVDLGPVVVGGAVYLNGGSNGGMSSIDQANVVQNWFRALPLYGNCSPTLANGKLLVYDKDLDIVEPSSGVISAAITDPNYNMSGYGEKQSPVVVGNYAYATNGGRLIAFDLVNKVIAWTLQMESPGQMPTATRQIATDGTELFFTNGGILSSRDPANGNLLWTWWPNANHVVKSNVIVTLHHIIVSDGTTTYFVNRTTHATEKTLPIGGNVLAEGDDTLVVSSTTTGIVTALRTHQSN